MDNNSLREVGLTYTTAIYSRPVGVTTKGIIIFPDRYGISSSYMQRYTEAVAQRGFMTLMPDFFRGLEWQFERDGSEYRIWKKRQIELIPKMIFDLKDAIRLIKEGGAEYIGMIGFGLGAELMLRILKKVDDDKDALFDDGTSEFSSLVLFYPDSMDMRWGGGLKIPSFFIFGENDHEFPLSQVIEFAEYLDKAPVPTEWQVFRGQGHGFAHLDGMDASESSLLAANKMIEWHIRYMGGRTFQRNDEIGNWLTETILRRPPTDTDWWPNGPSRRFYNVGLATWENAREKWRVERQQRPASPPPVDTRQLLDIISSNRRTGTLPGRMKLSDLVDALYDIWDDSDS